MVHYKSLSFYRYAGPSSQIRECMRCVMSVCTITECVYNCVQLLCVYTIVYNYWMCIQLYTITVCVYNCIQLLCVYTVSQLTAWRQLSWRSQERTSTTKHDCWTATVVGTGKRQERQTQWQYVVACSWTKNKHLSLLWLVTINFILIVKFWKITN